MSGINNELAVRALNYHGQQLTNFIKDEPLFTQLDLKNVDYHLYQQRSKELRIEDRGKRLLLHKFIAANATKLFKTNTCFPQSNTSQNTGERYLSAVLPPFETFALDRISTEERLLDIFNKLLAVGDVIYCKITAMNSSGLLMNACCFADLNLSQREQRFKRAKTRYLYDLKIKCFCPAEELVAAHDAKDPSRSYSRDDYVAVTVLEVKRDVQRLLVGMKIDSDVAEDRLRMAGIKLGLVADGLGSLPQTFNYALLVDDKDLPFESILKRSVGFSNPTNVESLVKDFGLSDHAGHSSLMTHLGNYPDSSMAEELRKRQAANAAFKHVAVGIKHFKAGENIEAFQCLNMALKLDPENVEALVARGALYANNGSLDKAIVDFESALALKPTHKNATKYWCETQMATASRYMDDDKIAEAREVYVNILGREPSHKEAKVDLCKAMIAQGRQLEREGKMDQAITMYNNVLGIDPENNTASDSIWYLKTRLGSSSLSLNDSSRKR